MQRISRTLMIAVLGVIASPIQAADVPAALPAETEQVMFVNFRQILDSDIIKKFALGQLKQALKQNDAQKVLEELGLDPLKDLDKVVVGIWGADPQNMDVLATMSGKFDPDKLLKAAEKAAKDMGDKVTVVEEGNIKLIKMAGDSGKPFFATVADEKTLVGGTDKKIVAKSVDAIIKKAKPSLSKELSALVLKQDDKASMWLCGITEGKFNDVNVPDGIPGIDSKALKSGLTKMNTISFTLRLGEDVNIALGMGMKDADAADEFSATLGKLIDFGKVALPLLVNDNPQAKGLVDDITKSIKAESKDKDVSVKAKISAETLSGLGGGKD